MPLIIETGDIIPNANTYVSLTDYIEYALLHGYEIDDTEKAETELIKAAQYISSKEALLKGDRVDKDQSLSFPRRNVIINGFRIASNEIPDILKRAQMSLALDIHAGIDPYNPQVSQTVKKERVEGVVEVEYHGATLMQQRIVQSASNALVAQLLKSSGFSVPLVRA